MDGPSSEVDEEPSRGLGIRGGGSGGGAGVMK